MASWRSESGDIVGSDGRRGGIGDGEPGDGGSGSSGNGSRDPAALGGGSSTAGSASALSAHGGGGGGGGTVGRGAPLSASSCSTTAMLGPEAALELLPCAALVFDTLGRLTGVNSKAAELHTRGLYAGAPLSDFAAGAELRDGRRLKPDEAQQEVLRSTLTQFHQQVGPARWLLSQATLVQHPSTGQLCVVLTQVDISDAKQVRCLFVLCSPRLPVRPICSPCKKKTHDEKKKTPFCMLAVQPRHAKILSPPLI